MARRSRPHRVTRLCSTQAAPDCRPAALWPFAQARQCVFARYRLRRVTDRAKILCDVLNAGTHLRNGFLGGVRPGARFRCSSRGFIVAPCERCQCGADDFIALSAADTVPTHPDRVPAVAWPLLRVLRCDRLMPRSPSNPRGPFLRCEPARSRRTKARGALPS